MHKFQVLVNRKTYTVTAKDRAEAIRRAVDAESARLGTVSTVARMVMARNANVRRLD